MNIYKKIKLKNKIKKLLENNNFRNNQNYIFGKKIKRKIVSNFLMYKPFISYFDEKYAITGFILDSISNIFVFLFNLFFEILIYFRVKYKISLFFSTLIYIVLVLFLIFLIISNINGNIIIPILIILVYSIRGLFIFLKSKLDLNNFLLIFKKPYLNKINLNNKKSNEGYYGMNKYYYIEKKYINYNKELNNYLKVLIIIIIIFILFGFVVFNGIKEYQKNIIYKKNIIEIFNGKKLLPQEEKLLYTKLEKCYKDNFGNIKKIDVNYNNLYIKDKCLGLEEQMENEIINSRSNFSKEYIEKKLEENDKFINNKINVIYYKNKIKIHNIKIDINKGKQN